MLTQINQHQAKAGKHRKYRPVSANGGIVRFPLLAYGFRPFFLLSGLFALIAVPAWLVVYRIGATPLGAMPGQLWHAHEMIFGFVVAAMSGFLLTAVPSWTGHRGFAGPPLLALTLTWLAGRMAFACGQILPVPVLATLDLAFLPALAALLAPPLLRERNRNIAMLGVLTALWAADAVFLAALSGGNVELGSRALLAATNIALLLLTIIGGRIVPAFTGNALRRADASFTLHSYPWIERILPAAMLAVIVVDAWQPRNIIAGVLALAVAILQAWRLSGWRSLRTRGDPILWVLHVAYAWLPLGFALKAIARLTDAGWAQYWQHALGIGALATMILAVTTRASLGHTGRPLVVHPAIAIAYGLVTLAALIRVAGSALWPGEYFAVLLAAGACWTAAFGIFVAVYGPILTAPRADGRPRLREPPAGTPRNPGTRASPCLSAGRLRDSAYIEGASLRRNFKGLGRGQVLAAGNRLE